MIKIIEKEPFQDYDQWQMKDTLLYPNYMIKEGKEYFILNRRSPQPSYKDNENKKVFGCLKSSNGKFTYFYNHLISGTPYDFLEKVIDKKYSFEYFTDIKECNKHSEGKFSDFRGNLKEISSAFHYRIYDIKMINNIKNIVYEIKNNQYGKAKDILNQAKDNYYKVNDIERLNVISAARSNYVGMTALVGKDHKLYLGKTENYNFNYRKTPSEAYYDNRDNSLYLVSDTDSLFPFLYGIGWVLPQQEMLDKGLITKEHCEEFEILQNGVLSQFEKCGEIHFANETFKTLSELNESSENNIEQDEEMEME